MDEFFILCGVLAWFSLGFWATVHDWTKHFDMKMDSVVVAFICSLCLGPLIWIVVWLNEWSPDTVVFKKKKEND